MKVSIIVPIYNVEKYLRKCMDSLVNQTLEEIEIILINDGSPDQSEQIINEYLKEYPGKIVYLKKENGGQASARNMGLEIAKGEYITFVDSDDWVDVNMLKTMYEKAKKENADILVSRSYTVTDGKEEIFQYNNIKSDNLSKEFILSQTAPWGKIFHRQLLEKCHFRFPLLRAYEDIIITMLGPLASKIVKIDNPFYYYLIREGSTMNQVTYSPKLEAIFPSLEYVKENFDKFDLEENYHHELEYIYIEHLLHGAALRFIAFDNYEANIERIIAIMKNTYPNWANNPYYKKESIKYKIVCQLIYKNKIKLLKKLLKK